MRLREFARMQSAPFGEAYTQSALFLTCANVEPPHAKAHSAQTVSRKSAVCTRHLTERRTPRDRSHAERALW